jgi:Kef-type K+ transport system membrane component KefB
MLGEHILSVMFLIFAGAVLFATVAIVMRQSMLVAYILLGLCLGPYGARLVPHAAAFSGVGEVGIVFLLFLVGLNLDPQELYQSLKKVSFVTLGASALIVFMGVMVAYALRYSLIDAIVIAISMVFSSTIIGLKLMRKEELFNSRRGELMISILLLQDLLAIVVLFLLEGTRTNGGLGWDDLLTVSIGMPSLLITAFLGKRIIIKPLADYFWHVKEYVFLLAIAWCLGLAQLGAYLGLSVGVGAFIGGISIASNSRLAALMRKRLNPLRDFFLVLFFFAIGASFNYHLMEAVLLPGILFCLIVVIVKPLAYYFCLRKEATSKKDALEVGFRLGQASEFSLLIAGLATNVAPRLISVRAEYTIEVMTLLSFILSCYYVVWRYRTPMVSDTVQSE